LTEHDPLDDAPTYDEDGRRVPPEREPRGISGPPIPTISYRIGDDPLTIRVVSDHTYYDGLEEGREIPRAYKQAAAALNHRKVNKQGPLPEQPDPEWLREFRVALDWAYRGLRWKSDPSCVSMARKYGYTPQTLRRRLKRNGSSWNDELTAMRERSPKKR
jgi:hypothetical protein